MVQVGRTAWADYCVPDDEALADVHFAIKCDSQGGYVRDLASGAGTLVNGAKVGVSPLRTGDEITAGKTVFSVQVQGHSEPGIVDESQESGDLAPATETIQPSTAADFCQHIALDDEARMLLREEQSPAEFLDLLIGTNLVNDAIRFLAIWLPKPKAVAWAGQCVGDVVGENLPEKEASAVSAALHWASEPSEENRRAAGAAAEVAGYDRATGLLAFAAFVSEGSLATPDLAPVPPAEGLTAQILSGALTMAAYHGDPAQATSRFQKFLEAGRSVALAGETT
jgi:predicted component of type VI protein secretion system